MLLTWRTGDLHRQPRPGSHHPAGRHWRKARAARWGPTSLAFPSKSPGHGGLVPAWIAYTQWLPVAMQLPSPRCEDMRFPGESRRQRRGSRGTAPGQRRWLSRARAAGAQGTWWLRGTPLVRRGGGLATTRGTPSRLPGGGHTPQQGVCAQKSLPGLLCPRLQLLRGWVVVGKALPSGAAERRARSCTSRGSPKVKNWPGRSKETAETVSVLAKRQRKGQASAGAQEKNRPDVAPVLHQNDALQELYGRQ